MSRSILFLNFALLALLATGGLELRRRWLEARQHELDVLTLKPLPAIPAPAVAVSSGEPAKVQAAQYFEVAEKFLFSRDRNPNVVIEAKAPPPPKVMPDFPGVYGVMDIGMGPTVFMSLGNAPQQGYKLGEKIGEFTLRAANQKEITFEWDGKNVTRPLDELRSKAKETLASAAPVERMNANVNHSVAELPREKPPENVRPAPGNDIGGGRKGCLPGDSSPGGTVADGYKKVSYTYAFGPICYWESSR